MTSLEQTIHRAMNQSAADMVNLAQLWAIGQYRQHLALDERAWSNLLQAYGVHSVHELLRTEAQQVIDLLSTASRLRDLKQTPANVHHPSKATKNASVVTSSRPDRVSSRGSTTHV